MNKVMDIVRLTPNKRANAYRAVGIDKVIIDGNEFTDYKAFSFLWEKSYVKSPVRSGDGTIGNLNSYATFLTPHLKIDFSLMSIDAYRKLMKLIYEKNEFTVTCYDVVNNSLTTNKMYFTTEEMPKLWTMVEALNGNEDAIELLGVQDYVVEMVGTNAPMEEIDVLYYDNNGNLIEEASQQVVVGTEFVVDYNFVAPSGHRFEGVWKDRFGFVFRNGDIVKANYYDRDTMSLKLYAQVVNTNEYTLSFSYGNGNVLYSQTAGEVSSVPILKSQKIGVAIAVANITLENGQMFQFPESGTGSKTVKIDDKTYEPYEFKGWYWTTEANKDFEVSIETFFNYDGNRTIYQIYAPKKYDVSYVTNYEGVSFETVKVEYAQSVPLPSLRKVDYTFGGWYTTSDFKDKTKFSGTMPPYPITLYAKWEKVE